jgi:hypothetical protein
MMNSTNGNMRDGCSRVVWCFVMDAAHSPATDFLIHTSQNWIVFTIDSGG